MNTNHNAINGAFVLVRPDLVNDPAGRANEIGIIVSNDAAKDDVEVSFRDNRYGLFASDALLVFLPVTDIEKNLDQMLVDIGFADTSKLMKIALILKYASGAEHFQAMELARDNTAIQALCLQTLEDKLQIGQNRGYEF